MQNEQADYYRERPSKEILAEQKLISKLKVRAFAEGQAYWEWDAESDSFVASPEWEKLTGHSASQVFPKTLNRETAIDPFLDDLIALIDGWASIIIPKDRDEAKSKASDFLLFQKKSGCMEHGYRIKRPDGKIVAVYSITCSYWEKGRLITLFSSVRDITKYTGTVSSAVAAAKNHDDIEALDKKVGKLSRATVTIKNWWPAFLVALVTLNDGLELIKKEINRFWRIISTPVETTVVETSRPTPAVVAENVAEIEAVLAEYSKSTQSTITLFAYSPGFLPDEFWPLLRSSAPSSSHMEEETRTRKTNHNIVIAERTQAHISGRSHEAPVGDVYSASAPVRIVTQDGKIQTLFFSIKSENATSERKESIMNARDNLRASIKKILNPGKSAQ